MWFLCYVMDLIHESLYAGNEFGCDNADVTSRGMSIAFTLVSNQAVTTMTIVSRGIHRKPIANGY